MDRLDTLAWLLRRYLCSTDHKVVGLLYAFTSLFFLLVGFSLVLIIRWHHAYGAQPVPVFAALLGQNAPGGVLLPEFFNQLGAMHGTIMVFLGVVPLAVGAFGNYVVPLQIGAPDMAFPRLNLASYWFYFAGGVVMLVSFFRPGGAASSGWTSYAPLAVLARDGQTFWLVGMLLVSMSSLLAAINFITTIVHLRAPGLTWFRLPFFVWAQFITAFLLLLAFPALQAAAVLQGMDRLADTSFFLPSGLVVSGQTLNAAGGGNALLWQHLFWFLAHPEVYVLVLPTMGIIAEIIANNTRKPLWGYRLMVYSLFVLGCLSFLVWGHHMFLTGMGTTISAFFQATTMIISIPSVVVLSALILSLYGGSIRFNTPMLFALAFLPMFGIGGVTGLPLGLATTDIPLHDTTYVIAHFHYLVAPGTIFALFAGIYYWFPKVTGRMMNETLGKIHFFGSLIFMNVIFMPMFVQGLAGVNRRLWDAGAIYTHAQPTLYLNVPMAHAALGLALFQLPFLLNLFLSAVAGRVASTNPWEATTLEWSATSTPPKADGNFERPPRVFRSPYEYSVPGAAIDFVGQGDDDHHVKGLMAIPYATEIRPDTRLTNPKLGIWLFLASEVMLFGSLFASYVLLRTGASTWPDQSSIVSIPLAMLNTVILIASSVTMVLSCAALKNGRLGGFRLYMGLTVLGGALFLAVKIIEYGDKFAHGLYPATSNFLGLYFTLTGLHAIHVIAGLVVNVFLWGPGVRMWHVDRSRFTNRVEVARIYWHFVDLIWIFLFLVLYLL